MFRLTIILVSLLLTQLVCASALHLIINGKAVHENKGNFNEENWGLGFEYDFDQKEKWIPFISGSFFKDSVSNTSTYFGGGSKRRYMLEDDKLGWHIDAGLIAFLMTRKDYKNNSPFFGALPFISVGTGNFAINATYIPSVSPKFEPLMFFQLQFKLSEW